MVSFAMCLAIFIQKYVSEYLSQFLESSRNLNYVTTPRPLREGPGGGSFYLIVSTTVFIPFIFAPAVFFSTARRLFLLIAA